LSLSLVVEILDGADCPDPAADYETGNQQSNCCPPHGTTSNYLNSYGFRNLTGGLCVQGAGAKGREHQRKHIFMTRACAGKSLSMTLTEQ
jgi:hypothetical protein